ncbi:MAG: AI-2E family transporter [Nitrospirota bacterium]
MKNQERLNRELIHEIKKVHHQIPRWIILTMLLILLLFFAFHATSILIILLLSGVVAYILSTIINKAESVGMKRTVAVVLLFILWAGMITGAEMLLSPYLQEEIKNFYSRLPEISQQVEQILTQRSQDSVSAYPVTEDVIRKILSDLIKPVLFINKTLNFSEIFSQAASFFLGLIIVPFFVFFLLKDWPKMLNSIMAAVPSEYVETTVSLVSEMNILVGKYLRGLTLDCALVGIIATCGLWLSGVNYPISLGMLTAAANVVPYLGPLLAGSAACLIAFIQFGSISAVVNIILLYSAIRLMDDLIIQPHTVGKAVKLHPMLLVLTIVISHKLFGIFGMVIAVPFVTALQKVAVIIMERGEHPDAGLAVSRISHISL